MFQVSKRSITSPFKPSIIHPWIRYSSSSSSSSNPSSTSPDVSQTKESNELDNDHTNETINTSMDTDLKASISTLNHTSNIEQTTTTTTTTTTTSPIITKTRKRSYKSSKPFQKKVPTSFNIPYVATTQHLDYSKITQDLFYQKFRPLLTPIKDQKKFNSLSTTLTPSEPKNNKAYWNTSVCDQEQFQDLNCVPKFIGDGMKAWKKPGPPGNEIRIWSRDDGNMKISNKVKKILIKLNENDKKKITAYRYYQDFK
ncbi:hypothetical protein BN7_1408 [Wickerhamomyces ciferrii]|uniref:Uncharacterized protein n=1 Tax=Wickerhamomyces ciferrii (strain ATCC 14091 / BCRC 22168 / CBS 111 / JCM 3599 / NBRC 0793 / NRRL Y-1031 F-60-10) TaxID=1206466 RepID=K0KK78_WICCF|nr:uncharacterized protein BN7_1408 [Wickerhamomyces ciferrii]CCH41869.1 hypothetical protein BN7_1408 [Wickerhamomyces ciferrii]